MIDDLVLPADRLHVGDVVCITVNNFVEQGQIVKALCVYTDMLGAVRDYRDTRKPHPELLKTKALAVHFIYEADFFGERVEFTTVGKRSRKLPWAATPAQCMADQAREYQRQMARTREQLRRMELQLWKAKQGQLRVRKDWSLPVNQPTQPAGPNASATG